MMRNAVSHGIAALSLATGARGISRSGRLVPPAAVRLVALAEIGGPDGDTGLTGTIVARAAGRLVAVGPAIVLLSAACLALAILGMATIRLAFVCLVAIGLAAIMGLAVIAGLAAGGGLDGDTGLTVRMSAVVRFAAVWLAILGVAGMRFAATGAGGEARPIGRKVIVVRFAAAPSARLATLIFCGFDNSTM